MANDPNSPRRNRPWVIAAVVFLALAVGGVVGYSVVNSQRMNESAARDGTTASAPPMTANERGTSGSTGSNVPPATR
jgi:hypothetical protein